MANVVVNDTSLIAIGDAIREKNGSQDKYKPGEMAAAIKDIQGGGSGEGLDEIESMIDNSSVLENTKPSVNGLDEKVGRLTSIAEFFNRTTALSFSGDTTLTTIDFYLGNPFSQVGSMFRGCTKLNTIVGVNTKYATSVQYMFTQSHIKTIQEPLDFSSVTAASNANAFVNASFLTEVRIVPGTMKWGNNITSGKLSDASIQSIVDGLADLTGGTQQKITLNATVTAKLTEAQIATITSKNWVVA